MTSSRYENLCRLTLSAKRMNRRREIHAIPISQAESTWVIHSLKEASTAAHCAAEAACYVARCAAALAYSSAAGVMAQTSCAFHYRCSVSPSAELR